MTTQPVIGGTSRIYAVIGDPVAQVRTPRLINPLFAQHGHDIVAVPFHTQAGSLIDVWNAISAMPNVAGIAVTVPHKVHAAGLCATLTEVAAAVGAVNTARRGADGTMHGALFDGTGFVRGLGDHRDRLKGATVVLIGAGGAGRAIAHALAGEGIARLHVIDSGHDAAAMTVSMVNRLTGNGVATTTWPDLSTCTIVINATPLGLKPDDGLPIPPGSLDPDMLVADIAALGRKTPLLAAARDRGCQVSDGDDMLKAQLGLVAGFIAGMPAGTALDQEATSII